MTVPGISYALLLPFETYLGSLLALSSLGSLVALASLGSLMALSSLGGTTYFTSFLIL
jgi:hypothetical protein